MQDRVPATGQEGRVLITPESGSPYYAKIEMADNPSQAGTPFNKENILQDMTAGMFSLDENAVPNHIFSYLGKYAEHWWRRTTDAGYELVVSAPSSILVGATGMGGGDTIQYSTSVSIAAGAVTLDNPITISPYNGGVSILRGKYFTSTKLSGVYYAGPDASVNETNDGTLYWYVECGQVTAQQTSTPQTDYVYSTDRNAYPDSGTQGGYEYQYLGIPFDNAVTAPKIATGSYVGTGKHGKSNPNTLTFDFTPKAVFIFGTKASNDTGSSMMYFWGANSFTLIYASYSGAQPSGTVSVSGNTMSWYDTNQTYYQCSQSKRTYNYIALG